MYHREHCYPADEFANDECIKNAYHTAKVDEKNQLLYVRVGYVDMADTNTILESVLRGQARDGVVSVPCNVVDRQTLDSHSSYGLSDAICDPFFESAVYGIVPDLCEKCWDCSNVNGCITQGGKSTHEDYSKEHNKKKESKGDSKNKKGHLRFLRFLGWMIFLGVLACGGHYLYTTRFANDERYGGGSGTRAFCTQLVGGTN